MGGKGLGRGPADAVAGAGDQDGAACQQIVRGAVINHFGISAFRLFFE
jgi:hypothetical protein